jgi:hypothetical protein
MSPQQAATAIRDALPPGGLFAGLDWRVSPAPFPLDEKLAKEIESLGRVLLQFYRAVNLLYRKSAVGHTRIGVPFNDDTQKNAPARFLMYFLKYCYAKSCFEAPSRRQMVMPVVGIGMPVSNNGAR